MSLEYKSTGALIDEWITARMKAQARPNQENEDRARQLRHIIDSRFMQKDPDIINSNEFRMFMLELSFQLQLCWDAQEIVMKYQQIALDDLSQTALYALARSAVQAQVTNAARCKLVREIDTVLGEADRTYLEKTYA